MASLQLPERMLHQVAGGNSGHLAQAFAQNLTKHLTYYDLGASRDKVCPDCLAGQLDGKVQACCDCPCSLDCWSLGLKISLKHHVRP